VLPRLREGRLHEEGVSTFPNKTPSRDLRPEWGMCPHEDNPERVNRILLK